MALIFPTSDRTPEFRIPEFLLVPLPIIDVWIPKRKIDGNILVTGDRYRVEFVGGSEYGVAYGGKALLLNCLILSVAKRDNTLTVDLGGSIYQLGKKLGYKYMSGSKNGEYTSFQRALVSLAETIVRVEPIRRQRPRDNARRIDQMIGPFDRVEGVLWSAEYSSRDRVTFTLTQSFFDLKVMPVSYNALRSLTCSFRAMQLYIYLAYNAPRVKSTGRLFTWRKLALAFDKYSEPSSTRVELSVTKYIQHICEVYPDLRVEVNSDGIFVKKSRPHVPPRKIQTGCG